jgi:hypothetical protein
MNEKKQESLETKLYPEFSRHAGGQCQEVLALREKVNEVCEDGLGKYPVPQIRAVAEK